MTWNGFRLRSAGLEANLQFFCARMNQNEGATRFAVLSKPGIARPKLLRNSCVQASDRAKTMGALLKLVDEQFGSTLPSRRAVGELRLVSNRTTVRDIIRQRVEAEVVEINQKKRQLAAAHLKTRSFLIDVEASSAEAKLNPPIFFKRAAKPIDASAEVERAIAAFEQRKFILLLDERQIEEIDAPVTIMPESEVVFLYLTPLKGG